MILKTYDILILKVGDMMPMKFKLKVLLAMNSMTQKQVSEMVGIRQPTISAICTGQIKEIPVHLLEKLCRVLHCQPNDIMEYVPDEE